MRVEVSSREVLMTIQEFALAIYRSIWSVRKYIDSGKIDYVQAHKYAHRFIPASELKKFGIRWNPYKWKGRG
jgi:hypothetical protein